MHHSAFLGFRGIGSSSHEQDTLLKMMSCALSHVKIQVTVPHLVIKLVGHLPVFLSEALHLLLELC